MKLAVMYVHGVEIADPRYAETSIDLLRREFTRIAGVDADDALAIRPALWAPVFEHRQDQLLRRMGGARAEQVFGVLDRLAGAADRGSATAIFGMIATGLVRSLPWTDGFHFPTLRWLVVHYAGDAIAYQPGPDNRALYDKVHKVLAESLHALAEDAGDEAPLCVLAHSLGSVVSSDFFYDLQAARGLHGARAGSVGRVGLADQVTGELGDTPVERGETLAWFHTLGSPLALWAQRYADFGRPLTVPDPALAEHQPRVQGRWSNVWDPDDIIAAPLRPLNDAYAAAVTEDRKVDIGPWWLGWTPLAHPFYWNDLRVITPIATSLARAWHRLHPAAR